MTNTQHTTSKTVRTMAMIGYIVCLVLAYHQGGVGMASYTAFTLVAGWCVCRSNYSN